MLDSLGSAIDELASIDPVELSDAELHQLVMGLEVETSRLAAARAKCLAAWDGRRIWADDGSKAGWARLAREADRSARSARRELKRARKLTTMPHTAAAMAEGKLARDQADLLGSVNQPDVAHLFERDEQ